MTYFDIRVKMLEELEEENELKRRRKLRYAMKKRDEELERQYKIEHKNGYCPKCYCLLPMSGICDNCN